MFSLRMLLLALRDLAIGAHRIRALKFADEEPIVQVDSTTPTLCLALLDFNLTQALPMPSDQKVSTLGLTSLSNLLLA
jgi:hypothetical protein